jgi:lactam utilization protein B/allophanate hydrolase subunit 2
MIINCDIGERGAAHPVDRELMRHIDIANIACGGHAGDAESIAAFRDLAAAHCVTVSAHLSYPDCEHFGRVSLDLPVAALFNALDEQLFRLPGISLVKFHGALYNDAVRDPVLAGHLVAWLLRHRIATLIAPPESEIARAAAEAGIALLPEAFADRRYCRHVNGTLQLVDRSHAQAVFHSIEEAVQHCRELLENRLALICGEVVPMQAETLCIHSDSDIALPLLQALQNVLPPFAIQHRGLSTFVRPPVYGRQSIGFSPGGPQDRFSFETAHRLLASESKQSLEFILPPILRVIRPAHFILTGAHFDNSRIERQGEIHPLPHATVFPAEPGDVLRFGPPRIGLRGYLSWSRSASVAGQRPPPLHEWGAWHDPQQRIRLLPGPELDRIDQPESLIAAPWTISPQSDSMGMRLHRSGPPLAAARRTMISAPVTDGTVQLTPSGLIILLRHRQTVGGYPRVAHVIEVDLDRLAQFRPGEVVRFAWTDLDTARHLLQLRTKMLDTLAL